MFKWLTTLTFLLFLSTSAQALTCVLEWEPVTLDTAGLPTQIEGYNVYRSVNSTSVWAHVSSRKPNENGYTDENVPTGHICYFVTAYNLKGESGHSNKLCVTIPGAVPASPKNLKRR